jgi:hypothetical protein
MAACYGVVMNGEGEDEPRIGGLTPNRGGLIGVCYTALKVRCPATA